MKIKLTVIIFVFLCFKETIYSCPVWADPHKNTYMRPDLPHNQAEDREGEAEQWPMAGWVDPSISERSRVRRRDSDLIPLDLEVFRRENIGPKPVWRDPRLNEDYSPLRKQNPSNVDEQ